MNTFAFPALMAAGTIFASRTHCNLQRSLGVGLIGLGMMTASPAMADQNVMVGDNGTVHCDVSLKDLSRISLRDDKFASVSKVQSGIQNDDFEVVNEPIRGDIYLSLKASNGARSRSSPPRRRAMSTSSFARSMAMTPSRSLWRTPTATRVPNSRPSS